MADVEASRKPTAIDGSHALAARVLALGNALLDHLEVRRAPPADEHNLLRKKIGWRVLHHWQMSPQVAAELNRITATLAATAREADTSVFDLPGLGALVGFLKDLDAKLQPVRDEFADAERALAGTADDHGRANGHGYGGDWPPISGTADERHEAFASHLSGALLRVLDPYDADGLLVGLRTALAETQRSLEEARHHRVVTSVGSLHGDVQNSPVICDGEAFPTQLAPNALTPDALRKALGEQLGPVAMKLDAVVNNLAATQQDSKAIAAEDAAALRQTDRPDDRDQRREIVRGLAMTAICDMAKEHAKGCLSARPNRAEVLRRVVSVAPWVDDSRFYEWWRRDDWSQQRAVLESFEVERDPGDRERLAEAQRIAGNADLPMHGVVRAHELIDAPFAVRQFRTKKRRQEFVDPDPGKTGA